MLFEQPVEERVSDRTRKVLEAMRRDRLVNQSKNNISSSHSMSSLSRQSSFLIDSCGHESATDSTHSLSDLIRNHDPTPTVQKYLRSSDPPRQPSAPKRSKSARRTPRCSLSELSRLEAISGSASSMLVQEVAAAEPASSETGAETGAESTCNSHVSHIDNLISTCDKPFDNDITRSFDQSFDRGSENPSLSNVGEFFGNSMAADMGDSDSGSSS